MSDAVEQVDDDAEVVAIEYDGKTVRRIHGGVSWLSGLAGCFFVVVFFQCMGLLGRELSPEPGGAFGGVEALAAPAGSRGIQVTIQPRPPGRSSAPVDAISADEKSPRAAAPTPSLRDASELPPLQRPLLRIARLDISGASALLIAAWFFLLAWASHLIRSGCVNGWWCRPEFPFGPVLGRPFEEWAQGIAMYGTLVGIMFFAASTLDRVDLASAGKLSSRARSGVASAFRPTLLAVLMLNLMNPTARWLFRRGGREIFSDPIPVEKELDRVAAGLERIGAGLTKVCGVLALAGPKLSDVAVRLEAAATRLSDSETALRTLPEVKETLAAQSKHLELLEKNVGERVYELQKVLSGDVHGIGDALGRLLDQQREGAGSLQKILEQVHVAATAALQDAAKQSLLLDAIQKSLETDSKASKEAASRQLAQSAATQALVQDIAGRSHRLVELSETSQPQLAEALRSLQTRDLFDRTEHAKAEDRLRQMARSLVSLAFALDASGEERNGAENAADAVSRTVAATARA